MTRRKIRFNYIYFIFDCSVMLICNMKWIPGISIDKIWASYSREIPPATSATDMVYFSVYLKVLHAFVVEPFVNE